MATTIKFVLLRQKKKKSLLYIWSNHLKQIFADWSLLIFEEHKINVTNKVTANNNAKLFIFQKINTLNAKSKFPEESNNRARVFVLIQFWFHLVYKEKNSILTSIFKLRENWDFKVYTVCNAANIYIDRYKLKLHRGQNFYSNELFRGNKIYYGNLKHTRTKKLHKTDASKCKLVLN